MEDRLSVCMSTIKLVADLHPNLDLVEQSFSNCRAIYVNRSTVEQVSNHQELLHALSTSHLLIVAGSVAEPLEIVTLKDLSMHIPRDLHLKRSLAKCKAC
jgi:hypothetical protein